MPRRPPLAPRRGEPVTYPVHLCKHGHTAIFAAPCACGVLHRHGIPLVAGVPELRKAHCPKGVHPSDGLRVYAITLLPADSRVGS